VKERIQKVLANAGVASRRHVEEMVRQGRITVNGKSMMDLPILIDPGKDRVVVDGEPIKLARERGGSGKRFYFLLNKPKGVYSTNVAQGAQVRAIDLLPKSFQGRVYPVGRLDAESSGLLLLTNDGELTNQLTHPRYGVAKIYRAVVDGNINPGELQELEKGIWLADPHTGRGIKVELGRIRIAKRTRDKTILELEMREGRNREFRRVLAQMGHKVRELVRIRMGPMTLEGLNPGQFRELMPREVKALHKLGERLGEKKTAADLSEE
jgi:23S rRNA pseudouridine2605 synthase